MTTAARYFATVPRVSDPAEAARVALDVIRWSDEFDLDGILLYTGAGAVLDPWVGAAVIAASTRRLTPLVALNPLYTHPYAAARSLLSVAEVYGRRVDVNLITGAALSELSAVGDTLDHRDRYARLREYVELFMRLLEGRPVTFTGRFYRADALQLTPALPSGLRPRLYLAGRSADARDTARALGATLMGMLPEEPERDGGGIGAAHFGVLARNTAQEAEEAAARHFPADPVGREVLRMSMANTDSAWRRALAEDSQDLPGSPFRLEPFRTLQADCPYLVGDHDTVAGCIARTRAAGVHTFVMDAPTTREDFAHLAKVVQQFSSSEGEGPVLA